MAALKVCRIAVCEQMMTEVCMQKQDKALLEVQSPDKRNLYTFSLSSATSLVS